MLLFNPFVLIAVVVIAIILVRNSREREYKNTSYYQTTNLPYAKLVNDTGKYGEYLIYKYLSHHEGTGAKFLFNLYIPKESGGTSEIDVLMICPKGLFVFESKNYSGWIFGSESQKNWYQTLPQGRNKSHKEPFYNPIMQNKLHIKHLKGLVGEQIPMYSVIAFSERCTLKSVRISSKDVKVVNRYDVSSVVSDILNSQEACILDESLITNIYNTLYPYTQVDDAAKERHIANIHNVQSSQMSNQMTNEDIGTEQNKECNMMEEENKIDDVPPSKSENVGDEAKDQDEKPQTLTCPKCNGTLVLRTATRGVNVGNHFYGCSNYPRCKYIQNIAVENAEEEKEEGFSVNNVQTILETSVPSESSPA